MAQLLETRKPGSAIKGEDVFTGRRKQGTLSRSLRLYQTGSKTSEVILRNRNWVTIDCALYDSIQRFVDTLEFNMHWKRECWTITRSDFDSLKKMYNAGNMRRYGVPVDASAWSKTPQ